MRREWRRDVRALCREVPVQSSASIPSVPHVTGGRSPGIQSFPAQEASCYYAESEAGGRLRPAKLNLTFQSGSGVVRSSGRCGTQACRRVQETAMGYGFVTEAERSLRPRIFLARRFTVEVEARIRRHYEVLLNEDDAVMSDAELAHAARGCAYLMVSATDNVSGLVFQSLAGTLRAVGTVSVGFNHIDLDAARAAGVAVFYSPGVLSEACAEMGLMLLLNAARRGHEADALMRSGEWRGYAPTQLLGVGLTGRRAGILGMGRIGQEVRKRLRAFGVTISYHNRHRLPAAEESDATYCATAEELLSVSDFLMICAPGTTGLTGFLNRERIALLPPGAIVVNISRGDTVDDDALIEALESGRVFAAGLDVFANEPAVDPRYRALPNVFLTPHIASATVDARDAMGFLVLDGFQAMQEGRSAENQLC